MSRRKQSLPGWFPFALVSSGLIAIAAGIRSGWRGAGEISTKPATPQPPIAPAGVVHGWGPTTTHFDGFS